MTEYKWYKLPPLNHTIEETSRLIELIKEKHNPDRLNIKMRKINDVGRYLIEIYLRKEI